MPEQEDDSKSKDSTAVYGFGGVGENNLMDMDLDLENSWSLDQISFLSNNNHHNNNFNNPLSPFLLTSSDHQLPCSPLWAFSDADDDNNNTNKFATSAAATSAAAGLRFSDYPLLVACNPNSGTEAPAVSDEKKKLPSPLLGLMPIDNPDGYCIIKERMTQALRKFKDSTEQHILAQIWAPVKNGGRYVLTTSGQPFVIDSHSNGLHQYRMVSAMYVFSMDGESDGELGLPGRVFQQKLPEWTPNVQYYSSREYSRRDHALSYNVQGTVALPVFEHSGQHCVGVLELIMTSQKINYAPEVDKVCKALEAVNLKSSEMLDHPTAQICNEGRKNALAEILEILTVVCETHKLALAQTWIPCMHRSVLAYGGGFKKSCTSFDGSCNGQVCMSATDLASYVVDPHMWGFRDACLEHHLQRGQGVAGRAFLSHSACFCQDITQFCKTDYPLVHYARLFGLTGCFAICLRSSHTGDDDYVLEFFLPTTISDSFQQKALLGSILATMKPHFQSLKVASGMDLDEEEGFVEIIRTSANGRVDLSLEYVRIPQSPKSPPDANALPIEDTQMQSRKNPLVEDLDVVDNECNPGHAEGSHTLNLLENKGTKKTSGKRGKTEKTISLEVLQQYFAGSLKDAAKSLGVCPTTMKRICRQHGISRWPSRKINKVNRSLSKLKRVIESVQGAEGAFDLTPLATSPLPVAVGSISWPSNLNGCTQQNSPNCKSPEPHVEKIGSPICKTPESDGRTGTVDHLGSRILSREELFHQNGFSPELGQSSKRIKAGSGSREESVGTPTSHGSCQGSPANDSMPAKDASFSPAREQCSKAIGSPELTYQAKGETNMTSPYLIPDALVAREPFREMLIRDAGSSKDLRNLCRAVAADVFVDERVPESSWTNHPSQDLPSPQVMAALEHATAIVATRQEMKSVTIKATYRDDIIRFRIALSCGIVELKEEVAKRLKLEVGTFDIKYLDDDHEWVLIACDADLQECIDISRSSGSNIIRLSVHDMSTILGSSCESTGEL
ncbi:protein NLP7-like [Mercurialis annua]|uniref:protein NLP7-like n=1 Tax=Mercurialis annua TaxID=3986 RepID=UPI00215FFBC0|nr:protein NLP7-like [Mercurialis annua]